MGLRMRGKRKAQVEWPGLFSFWLRGLGEEARRNWIFLNECASGKSK
jgi:hypothetical protein